MAELPDLQTSQIGFLSAWNALDHGADTISPTDVLSYSDVKSYTTYDNGVEGTLTHQFRHKNSRDFSFRVTGDGWIMVWFDRTTSYAADSTSVHGYIDIIDDWTSHSVVSNPTTQTTLSAEINQLRKQLSNSSETKFNHADCALHSYEHGSSAEIHVAQEKGDYDNKLTGGVSYPSRTTLLHHETGCRSGDEVNSLDIDGDTVVTSYHSTGLQSPSWSSPGNMKKFNGSYEFISDASIDTVATHLLIYEP